MVDDVMLILNRKLSPDVVVSVSQDDGFSYVPEAMAMEQNYPNPFNGVTTIRFSLAWAMEVTLEVFDTLGRRVSTLATGRRDPGTHAVRFDSAMLPSGVYFAQLRGEGTNVTQKMILLR